MVPRFAGAAALLCSYAGCDAAGAAALRRLRGTAEPPGRLPVVLE